jgi:hypothetical protein
MFGRAQRPAMPEWNSSVILKLLVVIAWQDKNCMFNHEYRQGYLNNLPEFFLVWRSPGLGMLKNKKKRKNYSYQPRAEANAARAVAVTRLSSQQRRC